MDSQQLFPEQSQHKKKKGKKVRFGPLTGILRSRKTKMSSGVPAKLHSTSSSGGPGQRRYSADDTSLTPQETNETLGGSLAQSQREVFSDDENNGEIRRSGELQIPPDIGAVTYNGLDSATKEEQVQGSEKGKEREEKKLRKKARNKKKTVDKTCEEECDIDISQPPSEPAPAPPPAQVPVNDDACQDACQDSADGKAEASEAPNVQNHDSKTLTELFVHGNAWIEKTLATTDIAFPHSMRNSG